MKMIRCIRYKWSVKVLHKSFSKKLKKAYGIGMVCLFLLAILTFSTSSTTFALENTPPTLSPIEDKIVNEGETITFILNATDPDGDPLNFSAIGLPLGAIFDIASGNFTWTPNYDQAGNYSIQFIVTDINGATDSKNMSIQVLDFNRPPSLDPIEDKEIVEGEMLSFIVSASDPDGDVLTFYALGLPETASFNSSTGVFQWTPTFNDVGNHSITFMVLDGKGGNDSKTIIISVISKEQKLKSSIDELIKKVENYHETGDIDNKGIKNSLISKLNAAKKKLLEERLKPAKNIINAFLNQVKAQSGKHISNSAALSLIKMAKAILQMFD